MADFSQYCILSDLHVFYLIIAQIKQTSNYLNHIYYTLIFQMRLICNVVVKKEGCQLPSPVYINTY